MSEQHINTGIGLRVDDADHMKRQGSFSYVLNGVIESFDGQSIAMQTEQANEDCASFPVGYKSVGHVNMPELNKTFYWLTNPVSGNSIWGYTENCTFIQLINDSNQVQKLGWDTDFPIHQIVPKVTNCSTQFYWADNIGMRYFDLDKLPWAEQYNPNNDFEPIVLVGQLDTNKMLVQPLFSVPEVESTVTPSGGNLQLGTYQATIAYANERGNPYTQYYNVSNPVGIFEDKESGDFNLPTNYSITWKVSNLDTSGLWDYFNLVIVKTVNNITSVELVGTFPVYGKKHEYIYTGAEVNIVKLTPADIFQRYQFYNEADGVFMADDRLGWYGMRKTDPVNYQQIFSKLKVGWQTTRIPHTKFQAYNNGVNTEKYRGYTRDEVYALEGAFVLDNGEITDFYHIPGRAKRASDATIINNADSVTHPDPCAPPRAMERWEVYNTGSVTGTASGFSNDDCYIGPHEYGENAYWESAELYPNNPTIYGTLAGTPIRHHKLPDTIICPINSQGGEYIYALGFQIDIQSVYAAINSSNLTAAQKARIKGIKIARANRKGNESVIAKGYLSNCGVYNDVQGTGQTTYFGNWPYNSIERDPFFASAPLGIWDGYRPTLSQDYFPDKSGSDRFMFYSPETLFGSPSISDNGQYLKMEQAIYGTSKSHFVKVQKNAEYKFLKRDTLFIGVAAGLASTIGIGFEFGFPTVSVSFAIKAENFIPSFTTMIELLEKLTPTTNFGYSFNSIGHYDNYTGIPNAGFKQRGIETNRYITDGKLNIDGDNINHFKRERCIYIRTSGKLLYPTGYGAPADNSRYNLASIGGGKPEAIRDRTINGYYGAIKRVNPSQYGRLYSYQTIDTGYFTPLYQLDGTPWSQIPAIFGGDTFINMMSLKTKLQLFLDHTVNGAPQADINYDELGNLGYPMFWLSTKSRDSNLSPGAYQAANTFMNTVGAWYNILLGGLPTLISSYNLLIQVFESLLENIMVKNLNLDQSASGFDYGRYYEQGIMYLFAYGIPNFFCESGVNVDFRQAYNNKEGNFYPRVTEGIPDDWLQEIEVPIKYDNTYTYNSTYSKQNKEAYFSHLRDDWNPNKLCSYQFPNRVIWSDKSSLEEVRNNWVIYKPVNFKDLPKSFGGLVSIDRLQDRLLLVRFSNKSQLYNATTTIDTSTPLKAYLGNDELFSTPPIDLGDSSAGYAGSQHKMLIKTEFGHVWCDAMRGQVLLLNGNQVIDLGNEGLNQWFNNNLPFEILNSDPTADIDNHFNGYGLHGVYDSRYKRLIITKLDVKREGLLADTEPMPGVFVVPPPDDTKDPPRYEECDRSWTLSYSFLTNSWVSFHSYRPNFYVSHPQFFQSGLNADGSVWNHNIAFDKYHTYYGEVFPYILEYPVGFKQYDEILSSAREYASALIYEDKDSFYEPDEPLYFEEYIAWNRQQCTGKVKLIHKTNVPLAQRGLYPLYTGTEKRTIYTKSDNLYQYNFFTNSVIDRTKPFFTRSCDFSQSNMDFDETNLAYTNPGYDSTKKAKLRAKDTRIRLMLNQRNDFKLINRWIVAEGQISYK